MKPLTDKPESHQPMAFFVPPSDALKRANTEYPVLDLIKKRWSARSFSDRPVDRDSLLTLIEAASWAPSANNEQPWQFFFAQKGSAAFEQTWKCLMPGNQPWTKQAAAFIITVAQPLFSATGKPNAFAAHDLGLATSQLILQAREMGIFSHIMAGFHKASLKEVFGFSENQDPLCIIALGYPDAAEKLEEPFRSRELTPRSRKPLDRIAIELNVLS